MGPFRSLDPPESLTYRQANNFPPDIKFCTGDPSQRTIPESLTQPGKSGLFGLQPLLHIAVKSAVVIG